MPFSQSVEHPLRLKEALLASVRHEKDLHQSSAHIALTTNNIAFAIIQIMDLITIAVPYHTHNRSHIHGEYEGIAK